MENLIQTVGLLNDWNVGNEIALRENALRKIVVHDGAFEKIISLENLFDAWKEFRVGKSSRLDVKQFEAQLEDNIFRLNAELKSGIIKKTVYDRFEIHDPKPRVINKAPVADRMMHNAICRIIQPAFEKTFIHDSYSCRVNKGTHKAFRRLVEFTRIVSQNNTRPCLALKCDIRKFFDSIDHNVLKKLLSDRIGDTDLLRLLYAIIDSFQLSPGKGMPLGNLTSQLFANVYMDPLDKFVKHRLKAKYYIRYADDFIILSSNEDELMGYLVEMNLFLKNVLNLIIHPHKIYLRKLTWGIDFVGYVVFPHHSLPRRKTVKRIFRSLTALKMKDSDKFGDSLCSYLGHLKHVNSYKLSNKLCHDFDIDK